MRIARMKPESGGGAAAATAGGAAPSGTTAALQVPAGAPAAPATPATAGETGRVIPGPGAGTKPVEPSLDDVFGALPKPVELPKDEEAPEGAASPDTGSLVDQIAERVLARLEAKGTATRAPTKPQAAAEGEGAETDPVIVALDRLASRVDERFNEFDRRVKGVEEVGSVVNEERAIGRIFGDVRSLSARFGMDEATRQAVTQGVFKEMVRAQKAGEKVTERTILAAFNERLAPLRTSIEATKARLRAERERGEAHGLPPASGSPDVDPDAVIAEAAQELGLPHTKVEDMGEREVNRLVRHLQSKGISVY